MCEPSFYRFRLKIESWGVFTCLILANIATILVSVVVILMSIESILEKCGHLQVHYSWLLSQYLASIAIASDHIFQVLAQYSWDLPQYLQVLSQFCYYWAGEYTHGSQRWKEKKIWKIRLFSKEFFQDSNIWNFS